MGKHSKLPPLKEDVSPNVVPMIDIMFLLLLFFMLGADMSQRESVEVQLPKADMVKEDKEEKIQDPETTINVHPDPAVSEAVFLDPRASRDQTLWVISLRGNPYTVEQLKTQLKIEADEFLEDQVDPQAGRKLSRKKVLIRAERTAPFGLVQKVIETAGAVGMYKVEVAGSKPTPVSSP
ncbi:MAG: biopolymer transporter ExbD [Planctomycetota bacterium]|nr:biopolymer transporter ExbD [Planctomycetota bacterium]